MSTTNASAAERAVFTIPADPKTADSVASELGELATATEWKRAAIVYARVRVQDGRGRPAEAEKVTSDLLSPAEYALLGIHGLRSKTTVRAYWRTWDNAVTEGLAQPVALGESVKLPDAEWADCYQGNTAPNTPPYYRPEPTEARESLDSPDTEDCGFGLELLQPRAQPVGRDTLGLGECPPLASDVERCEPSHRRNGGGGYRGKLPSHMTLIRAKSAIEHLDGLPDDQAALQIQICELIGTLLASMQPEMSGP